MIHSKSIENSVVLITGGTGSFGRACVRYILKNYNPNKLVIFSRDELKQYEMKNSIHSKFLKIMRFFDSSFFTDFSKVIYCFISVPNLSSCFNIFINYF